MIPHRRCESKDFDDFSPVNSGDEGILQQYKDGKRHLLCLDWDQVGSELEIFGHVEDETDYQSFEFLVTPCHYIHEEFGSIGDTIHKDCNPGKQQ